MRRNAQDAGCRSVALSGHLQNKLAGKEMSHARLVRIRVMICLFAFCLLLLATLVPLAAVSDVRAQSNCLLLCPPSSTPSPGHSPTPRPKPSPTARSTPSSTPTATARPTITVPASPEPTVAITEVRPTLGVSSNYTQPSVPGRRSASQPGSGVWLIGGIAVSVVFVLLLTLVCGWLFIRRALVPPIDAKLPPSGAPPWSRFRIPNPNSLFTGQQGQSTPERETTRLAINNAPGDFRADTLVSNAAGGSASGSWHKVPGGSEHPRRKKRGLITRAPYYTDLAAHNDERDLS